MECPLPHAVCNAPIQDAQPLLNGIYDAGTISLRQQAPEFSPAARRGGWSTARQEMPPNRPVVRLACVRWAGRSPRWEMPARVAER